MPDIMVLLACLSQCVEPTPLRQLGRVIEAMLSMSGRVTMRDLSRWSGKGGSYRTIQRLFNASSPPILEKGEPFPRVICIHALSCSHYKFYL